LRVSLPHCFPAADLGLPVFPKECDLEGILSRIDHLLKTVPGYQTG
jgi:hypothetical protein